MMRPHDPVAAAAAGRLYSLLKDPLTAKARELGYALLFHGSLAYDINCVAVPWEPWAVTRVALVTALIKECRRLNDGVAYEKDHVGSGNPEFFFNGCQGYKPHKRRVWSIHLGITYLDLSVMPLADHEDPLDRGEWVTERCWNEMLE